MHARSVGRRVRVLALCAGASLSASAALAQSDPSGFTTVINVPQDVASIAGPIGGDTQLNLWEGGAIAQNFVAGSSNGSETNIEVNIYAGSVGWWFQGFPGSEVNILGGVLGTIGSSGVLSISGGSMHRVISHATRGSPGTLTVTGGTTHEVQVWEGTAGISAGEIAILEVLEPAVVELAGGRITSLANEGELTIRGTDFRLDGVPISTLDSNPGTSVFSCVLEGGDVLVVDPSTSAELDGTVLLVEAAPPPAELTPVTLSTGMGPGSLSPGQSLTLTGDATVPNGFVSLGATLNFEGGSVGEFSNAVRSDVSMSGGTLGQAFRSTAGTLTLTGGSAGSIRGRYSQINVAGGLASSVSLVDGAYLTMTGGEVSQVTAFQMSGGVSISGGQIYSASVSVPASISGGAFDTLLVGGPGAADVMGGDIGFLDLRFSSRTVLSGGQVARFGVDRLAELEIVGSGFSLDGTPITGLVAGEPYVVGERDGQTLSGTLLDGTPFQLLLNPDEAFTTDFVDVDATLTLAVVDPLAPCACDWNNDSFLNATDFFDWINDYFGQSGPRGGSDFNADGSQNAQDFFDFVNCYFNPPVECQ